MAEEMASIPELLEKNRGRFNRFDNGITVEFVERLIEEGVSEFETEVDEEDEDRDHLDTLFFRLPEKITYDLLEEIVLARPGECRMEDDGRVRLWWD